MPLTPPVIDDRRYADLVDEALARVPVHTPEWTHQGESDPGTTLVELFAFLAESVLYRANRIPETSRIKFLQLLGIALKPAEPAQGLVVFEPTAATTPALTLAAGTELRASNVAFRTRRTIDVLPLQAQAFVKQTVTPADADQEYYRLLYESVGATGDGSQLAMYETRALDGRTPVDLVTQTVDGALWIALLQPRDADTAALRAQLAGRTLSLGFVPYQDDVPHTLPPAAAGAGAAAAESAAASLLRFELPLVAQAVAGTAPVARYQPRAARSSDDVLSSPGTVEIPLPTAGEVGSGVPEPIATWQNLDPLEAGVGDFPPAIEDSDVADRVLTWVRVVPARAARARFLWAGINAVAVDQRVPVSNERLADGDGTPDQQRALARPGVVAGSVRLDVVQGSSVGTWAPIDDLLAAGPEVRSGGALRAPGQAWQDLRPSDVFTVDAEAGVLRFGDGLRGRRPPRGARLLAHYDTTLGAAGNLPPGAINGGPALPPGLRVVNPLPTWGGTDVESMASGEKRVAGYIRHRDRLVTADDFAEIARRAPGADIGRVEVLPAWHPDLGGGQPGDAPGVVTMMVIPRPSRPRQAAAGTLPGAAPVPDDHFLAALCKHLDPRRLVTTELVLRGPAYVPIWLSLGISVAGGFDVPAVRDAVKQRLIEYLAPVRDAEVAAQEAVTGLRFAGMASGWPLRKAVNRLELMAEVGREPGVLQVNELLLAADGGAAVAVDVPLQGLQLPWIVGLSVELGSALGLDALRGRTGAATGSGTAGGVAGGSTGNGTVGSGNGANGASGGPGVVPVPVIPREC